MSAKGLSMQFESKNVSCSQEERKCSGD